MKKKQSAEALSRIQKNKLTNPSNINNTSQKSGNDIINKSNISQELSCIGDLSLSNHEHAEYLKKKSINLNVIDSYLIDFDNDKEKESNNISKLDNKNDLTNELLISDDDEKPIKLKTIKLKEKDNLYSNVKFKKPSSILTSILDLQKDKELQNKLDKMRKKFKLDKFLQKEKDNGINVDDLGRRNSFLDFLKYTQKKTNLNDYLIEEKEKEKRQHEKEVFDLINKNKNEEKKEDLNLTVEEENKKSKNESSNLEEMMKINIKII